jgi:uncharacterized protein (TIGR02996 family)
MTMSFDKQTQKALLQAILDEPDADAPRLVYADWLEEHGGVLPQGSAAASAYAGFIRKQIELAKVPEYDPLWVHTWFQDRDAITGRGFEAFCPPLPEGVRPTISAFHRGFLKRIEVQSLETFLTHAPALFAVAPLHELRLRANYRGIPPDLTGLASSPYLSCLRRLNFCLSRLPAREIERLQDSPDAGNLRELEFEFAGIAEDGCQALFRPPLITQLTRLRLHSNSVRWTNVVRDAPGPFQLRCLLLTEPTGSHLPAGVFEAPLLRGLTELDLGGNHLGPDGFARLGESAVLDGLESLGLAKTLPQVEGARALADCAKLTTLRRLDLSANRLGPVAVRLLAQSPHLANLRVVELNSNPLGDRGAQALAASPYLTNLVQLDLMHCEIGDAGAQALLESPHLDRLIRLNVYGDSRKNKISDDMKRRLRERFGDRLFA